MTADASVTASYQPMEGKGSPPARFIAQGPTPGIPMDSVLEVVGQLGSINLLGVTIPDGNPPRSLKIGVLHEVQPCGGLVIDFPEEDPVLSDNDDEEGSCQT
uniref:Replication protein A3 n=1 Tax=Romanomermis culicivorax TaxID=13658 RepID=A0A915I2Y3_ROMCU